MEGPLISCYLVSDVHLEFHANFEVLKPALPGKHVCLLAGDIGHPTSPLYRDFLRSTRANFDEVIVVAGNHEYYTKHKKVSDVLSLLREIAQEEDCRFLERETFTMTVEDEKISFLGCTLWSRIGQREYKQAQESLGDFYEIRLDNGRRLTPEVYVDWHRQDVTWLQNEIAAHSKNHVVIVTHHCPTEQVIDPIYHGHPLNSCFVTNLEAMFKPNVKLWACGHSHRRGITQINGSYCGLNPRGYPGENKKFDPLVFSFFKGGVLKLIM